MTALRIIALWLLVAAPVAVLVGTVLRRRFAATAPCPHCADLERQLVAKAEQIAGLKRANDAFHRANAALGVKVSRLEGRRERAL